MIMMDEEDDDNDGVRAKKGRSPDGAAAVAAAASGTTIIVAPDGTHHQHHHHHHTLHEHQHHHHHHHPHHQSQPGLDLPWPSAHPPVHPDPEQHHHFHAADVVGIVQVGGTVAAESADEIAVPVPHVAQVEVEDEDDDEEVVLEAVGGTVVVTGAEAEAGIGGCEAPDEVTGKAKETALAPELEHALAGFFQDHPEFFDKTMKEYKDLGRKEALLQEFADSLNLTSSSIINQSIIDLKNHFKAKFKILM